MRILHTMLRVGDLDKSIDFYVNRLGMNLLRKKDYPHGKFILAFVGYGSENVDSYLNNYADINSAFGHDHDLAKKHFIEHGFAEGRVF